MILLEERQAEPGATSNDTAVSPRHPLSIPAPTDRPRPDRDPTSDRPPTDLPKVAKLSMKIGDFNPRPEIFTWLRGHPELTFGGLRNGFPSGNGRHSSNRRHVTLVTAIVTDRYTGCSLSAVVTAVTSVTAVTLASLAVTVGARLP